MPWLSSIDSSFLFPESPWVFESFPDSCFRAFVIDVAPVINCDLPFLKTVIIRRIYKFVNDLLRSS